ncbi:AFG1-like ATPase-domain-containing protein [Halenospora varia]|nr:AFG1-like ATPase-domain-containing protein [Halenospora varia]
MSAPLAAPITSLTITNPLVLYRSLLSTKQILKDPAQYRLALHLQRLYTGLKDYSPQAEYESRLKSLSRAIDRTPREDNGSNLAAPGHPIRRNPLFAHLFSEKERRDTLALTRVLTNHEEAMKLDSPRGLLLHGEVGTGKSMMVDLLADCLPNRKKRRWHFNTFMLETLALLEQRRMESSRLDSEHSLLWLAKDMIEKSPILFLDEFQLPDRVASKILSKLLTMFFQLGGVLIASSNRMPDELAKASGVDFAAPSRGGFMRKMLGFSEGKRSSMFPANNEYAEFVDVLKARCEIWDIRGEKDWRRREIEEDVNENAEVEKMRETMIDDVLSRQSQTTQIFSLDSSQNSTPSTISNVVPKKYFLGSGNEGLESTVRAALPAGTPSAIPWESSTLLIYGRKVPVPCHYGGVTFWNFRELCEGTFGPADYITLASTFHTLVLDDVPVLHVTQKNEARRLITLLDALYEARCKLIICAEAGPDDLFFPEVKATSGTGGSSSASNDGGDAVYPETLSEVYQDQTSPFRPNISAYKDDSRQGYDPDEYSDFRPVPGKGSEIGRQVDFGMTGSFIGEDERFAYKRAASRLWEMCGARWHARSDPNWWRPLPLEVRRWERSSTPTLKTVEQPSLASDVRIGESVELDKPAGLQGKEIEERELMRKSTFTEERDPPTKIGLAHAWGMMKWGKKAGP